MDEGGKNNISNIIKVSVGVNYTLMLSEDGKIYSVGYNGYGQLAQGDTTRRLIPVVAKDATGNIIEDATDINARQYVTSIIREDGSTWTSGYNEYGNAGNNTNVNNKLYTKVLGEYGNGEFENSLLTGNTNNTMAIADKLGRVYTAGYNGYGQLGDGTLDTSKTLVGISHTSLKVEDPIVILNYIGEQKQINASMDLGFNILYKTLENEIDILDKLI